MRKNSHRPPKPEVKRGPTVGTVAGPNTAQSVADTPPTQDWGHASLQSQPYPEGTASLQKRFSEMARSCCGINLALHQPCEGWRAIPNCHAMLCVVCTSCPSPLCTYSLVGVFYVAPIQLHVVVPPALFLYHDFKTLISAFTSTVFALQMGVTPLNVMPA